jgi:hypothetical protein
MEHIETDFIMFNILLKSDIDTITTLYQESDVAVRICNDKYFWEKKFEHDNLSILKYRVDIGCWYDEYNEVKDSTIDADDIIKISLIEKERDSNIEMLHHNDGTIIMKFPDCYPEGSEQWFLPKELTYLIPEKLSSTENDIYPIQIKFSPNNNNTYKLTYELYCEGNDPIQDIEVSIDNLSVKEMKNIIIKSLYELLTAVDNMDTNYLFDDLCPYTRPYSDWTTNSKYYNFIKFTRIGMRDTFTYLRK